MVRKRLLLALFVAIVSLVIFFVWTFFDSEEGGEFERHRPRDEAGSLFPKRHGTSSVEPVEFPASFTDDRSTESDQAAGADQTLPRLPRRHHFRLRVETSDAKPAAQAEVQVFWEPADDHFGSWSKASAQQELRRRLENSPIVCDLLGQADLPQSRGHLHVLARSKDQRQLVHHRGLFLDRLRPPLLTLRLKPSGILRLKDIMAFNPEPFEIILQRSHHLSLVVKHDRDLSSDRMIFRVSGPSAKTCLKKWDFQQALALADDTQITAAHMDGLSEGKLELTIEYRPPMEWSNWRDDGAPKPVAAPILARQILDIPIQCPLTIDLRGSFRLEHLAASVTDGRPLKSTLLLRGYRGLALPTRLPRQYLQRPAIIRAPGHRPLIFAKNIAPGHHQLQPALRVRGQLRHGEKALSAKGLFCRVTDPYPWGDSSSNDYAVQADGSIEFEVPTTGRYTFWFYQLAGYDPAYELKAEALIDAAAPPASLVIAFRPRFP